MDDVTPLATATQIFTPDQFGDPHARFSESAAASLVGQRVQVKNQDQLQSMGMIANIAVEGVVSHARFIDPEHIEVCIDLVPIKAPDTLAEIETL